jgi:hypothetical protein
MKEVYLKSTSFLHILLPKQLQIEALHLKSIVKQWRIGLFHSNRIIVQPGRVIYSYSYIRGARFDIWISSYSCH